MSARNGGTTALTPRNVKRHAWREAQVNASVAGNASEAMLGTADPPGGFVSVELGFGFGEYPSLLATLHGLAPTNNDRRRTLARNEAKQKRETAQERQRWAKEKLRAAGRKVALVAT